VVVAVLLATAVLGLVTANAVGLTGLPVLDSEAASSPDTSDVLPVAPRFERTIDVPAQAPRSPRASPAPVIPDVAAPRPAAPAPPDAAPADEPAAAPPPPREPAHATVRPGDPCPSRGATGVTAGGKPTVCSGGRGHGRNRWRLA